MLVAILVSYTLLLHTVILYYILYGANIQSLTLENLLTISEEIFNTFLKHNLRDNGRRRGRGGGMGEKGRRGGHGGRGKGKEGGAEGVSRGPQENLSNLALTGRASDL